MIELNNKTQQDFLNREWVQRLLDAGVNMSDAKYKIVFVNGKDRIIYPDGDTIYPNECPTYTVSELLYKLHEWISVYIGGEKYRGGLTLVKDAPLYLAYYNLKCSIGERKSKSDYIFSVFDYPIETLANLLIQCHNNGIGDVGDISDK